MTNERSRSLHRAFAILEIFSRLRRPLTLKEFTSELDYPPSSIADLLKALSQIGCLAFDTASKTYFPTTRLAALGDWVIPEILPDGDPYKALSELRAETGETVLLGTPNDLEIQYLYVLEGPFGARYLQRPSSRRPLVKSGMGWIVLSQFHDDTVELIYRRSIAAKLITRKDTPFEQLSANINSYRRDGYVAALDSTNKDAALIAILLPRLWHGRQLTIGIGGQADRIMSNAAHFASVLRERAARLAGIIN